MSLRAFFRLSIRASIISIGSWGPLHYKSNKEPPKIVLVIIEARTVGSRNAVPRGALMPAAAVAEATVATALVKEP